MKLLTIDTSNEALALSISEDDQLLGSYLSTKKNSHSIALMPAIDQLVASVNLKSTELNRIAVAKGPGSYTGLRIGVTTAKTLAWTLGIELVGISSLAVLAGNIRNFSGLIIPIFNARRKNVYTGAYQWKEGRLHAILEDRHISLTSWLKILSSRQEPLYFVGTDLVLFTQELTDWGVTYQQSGAIGSNLPHGEVLAEISKDSAPEMDIKGMTPSYLKLVEAEEKWLNEQVNSSLPNQ